MKRLKIKEEVSPMVFNPNDYLMYDHIDSNWYCLSTPETEGTAYTRSASSRNFDTEWANYDFVTTGIDVSYLWPSKLYSGGPTHIAAELSAVTWTIIPPSGPKKMMVLCALTRLE